MSDNFFSKVLKGAAKLGTSYMSSTADSLSRNDKFSEEQREQYRDISNAFSDMNDKLNDNTSASDYNEDYYDDYNYENSSYDYEEENKSIGTGNPLSSEKRSYNYSDRKMNQVTFANRQWYLIHRNETDNTAILLSKDILINMPFSTNKNNAAKYETSPIYQWLNNDFKVQLESDLTNRCKKRLLKIFLLSSNEASMYMSKADRRVNGIDGVFNWWLIDKESDKKGGFIKTVNKGGGIGVSPATNICGVRPAILIRLKQKSI